MVIWQGDVFWIDLPEPGHSEPGYRRPGIVVQNDVYNRSGINTAIVVLLTSNLARAHSPGNVLLRKGEANLPRPSVANVTQVITVDKADLGGHIGRLSADRVEQILAGLRMVTEPRRL